MSSRIWCGECDDLLSWVGGSVAMIVKYLYRLASGGQNINFWEKSFFAGISAYKTSTFKTNLYLLWSLPLTVPTCPFHVSNVSSDLSTPPQHQQCQHFYWNSIKIFRQIGIEDIKLNEEGADLAMVKLKQDIDINTYPPICVPEPGRSFIHLTSLSFNILKMCKHL